jgi:hypothetical protein
MKLWNGITKFIELVASAANNFSMEKTAEKMVNEYMIAFPDRCLICQFHKYGIDNGLVKSSKMVSPHLCIYVNVKK